MFFGLLGSLKAHKFVEKSSEWKLIESQSGVNIYSMLQDCNLPNEGLYAEYFLLKFENTTAESVAIAWRHNLYYNQKCQNCNASKEKPFLVTLNPKEILEAECGVGANNGMRIHSKWTQLKGQPELDGFTIADLTIKPLKY